MNILEKISINICITFLIITNIAPMEIQNSIKKVNDKQNNKQSRLQNNKAELTNKVLDFCLNKAKKHLREGQLDQFDALVGDTACQIRAIMVALIHTKLISSNNDNPGDIALISEKDFEILKELVLLTCSKKQEGVCPNLKERSCTQTLNKNSGIELTKSATDKLIKKCQKNTSKHSVEFLKEQLSLIAPQDVELNNVLNFCKSDQFSRIQAPCYAAFKVIFKIIKANNIPIIVKITRICSCKETHKIRLTYKIDNNRLISCDIDSLDSNQAALVFEGYSEADNCTEPTENCSLRDYINFFNSFDIETVIFANVALHSQFTGVTQEELAIPFDQLNAQNIQKEIADNRSFAIEHGCVKGDNLLKRNCKLLLIYHVYCKTVKQEI